MAKNEAEDDRDFSQAVFEGRSGGGQVSTFRFLP